MTSVAVYQTFRAFTAGSATSDVRPLALGWVYTYDAGTLTPKATYTDDAGIVPNPNPTPLDARGEANIRLGAGAYKFITKDSLFVQQGPVVDNIKSIEQISGASTDLVRADLANTADAAKNAALVGFNPALNYAVGTVGWWDRHAGVSFLRYIPTSLHAGVIAGTNTADLSSYLQLALNDVLTFGYALEGHGYIYKSSAALTLQRSSASHATRLAVNNAVIDLTTMPINGIGLTVGAISQPFFIEEGRIVLRDVTLLGPENTALDPRTDTPGGASVGLRLFYAGGVTLENVNTFRFYNQCHSLFAFPVKAINCSFRRGWIGLHLDEVSNDQEWDGLTLTNCRYPILVKSVSTALDAGKTNNVIFRRPWFEGSTVGMVVDSGSGGIGAMRFRSIRVEDPYCALLTYDFFRVGTVWTLATPATRGANCTEFIGDFTVKGGLFNPVGGLFSATQALVAFDGTTRCRNFDLDAPAEGIRLDADAIFNAPAAGHAITRGYPGTSDGVVDDVWWNAGAVVRRMLPTGTVMVGDKSAAATVAQIGVELQPGGVIYQTVNGAAAHDLNREASDGTIAIYRRAGTTVGSVSVNATNTAFNTSSDYRLKDNIQPMDGAAALGAVMKWKIRSFKWRINGNPDVGVIAHELRAELPSAVHGEKDGIDMQGVDYSKMVPCLVAAVQYLADRLKTLEEPK